MAVTKIHPIKSTLKKALDYIENPDKTDEKLFVSSYGCSYETADIEFQMLLDQAYQKGNNLAHHLIQAFEPGETTAEQAHEIGRRLADEVLQGKYPYVITTHIDKGHLHNHIIFCAVDMANQRKYISNRQSYAFIRRTSDRLCKEHGLSVVKPGKDKGIAIDRGPRRRSTGEISLRIALEDSIKAQQSAGYARWAKLHNLKQAANSLNFITEHQIDSYEGLESRLAEISAANDAASALKDAERRLGDMALLIKNLSAYKQLRPVALELRNAKDKAAFRRQHESQLILYEAAAKALKEAGIAKLPNLYALKTEYKKLDIERERLSAQYSEAKQKLKEYGIVKQNVDSILRTAPGKEHTQER